MGNKNTKEFFEILGEIWRDITAIEFLMRVALAQKEGNASRIPIPPYVKGKTYREYPVSFSYFSFTEVVEKFNSKFPELAVPQELITFRNAMAHGCIVQINNSGVDEIFKFRKQKEGDALVVEFSMALEQERIQQIRQSLRELRRHISLKAADKNIGG
jgi:hypothetical protein